MPSTFYIAATDRMSWGRGTREWEAIAHALAHGGIGVKSLVLFQIDCPDGTTETDITVNEMGSIVAPKGSEVKEQGNMKATRMAEAFFSYKDEVDALLYPEEDGN